jgi:hypothetical protein
MEDYLLYPQGTLTKEERDINIFIEKKILNRELIQEVPCYIDPESGLVDICINQNRINHYSKYETILQLPAYLNDEESCTPEQFFEELVFISDTKNFNTYESQKKVFLKNTLEYNGWHVSSYRLIPNYCEYSKAMNQALDFAISKNIITKKDYIDSLMKIIGSEDVYDICLASSFDRAKAFYKMFNDDKKNEKVICFFDRK